MSTNTAHRDIVALLAETEHPDRRRALRAVRTLGEEIEWLTRLVVSRARRTGSSWAEIGRFLGLTRQGARKRFEVTVVDQAWSPARERRPQPTGIELIAKRYLDEMAAQRSGAGSRTRSTGASYRMSESECDALAPGDAVAW